jgi:hypothetical protein
MKRLNCLRFFMLVFLLLSSSSSYSQKVRNYGKTFKENDKYGWKDSIGSVTLKPIYDLICDYTDPVHVTVMLNGKWGFMNTQTGKAIVPAIYDWAWEFRMGSVAWVELNGKKYKINEQGQILAERKIQRVSLPTDSIPPPPSKTDIGLLCRCIGEENKDWKEGDENSPGYEYERLLIKFAGTTNDAPDRIEKVRAFWNAHGDKFICQQINVIDPYNSNVLKRYIANFNWDIIYNLGEIYKVDLNMVDEDLNGTRTTLLDYVLELKKKYSNSDQITRDLTDLYDILVSFGAKLAKDVPQ